MPDTIFTTLKVGEMYQYAIPHCPAGQGTYLGLVQPIGWLAFQDISESGEADGELHYLNPAVLSSLRPETWPFA